MDTNLQTDAQMYALVVGFLLPPVLAIIQQPGWSNGLRASLTFAASIVVGAGTAYFAGDLNSGGDLVHSALIVLVTAVATYHGAWKPTGIAPAVETATSPGAATVR